MDYSPWGYSFIFQVASIPVFWNVKPYGVINSKVSLSQFGLL